MTERPSPGTILVRSDAGETLRLIERPAAPRYELADGRSVDPLTENTFRIRKTGEIITKI